MKKKTRIILIIVGILILVALIFSAIYYEITQKQAKTTTNNETENNQKYKTIENVPLDYNFADMIEDKCYIVMSPNIVYHMNQLKYAIMLM